jgi:ParB/RepB/Spo0J family partition protein
MSTSAAASVAAIGPAFFRPDMPLAQLQSSPLNPRKHFDQGSLEELAKSIRALGVIEPLVARQVGDHYEIVAGDRRWRAAQLAELTTLPVMVKALTDAQALEIMVVENNQREDVSALEEADGFTRLLQGGYEMDRLAERLGRSKKYVYDRLKLLQLIPPAQQLLTDGRIAAGHGILLARLTPKDQARAIDPLDGGLFAAPSLYDDDDPMEAAALDAVSVREFDAWIAFNIRLDLAKPVAPDEYPAVAQAQETAARVVSITLQPFLDARQQEGASAAGDRILLLPEWTRADGTTEHPLHGPSVTYLECPQSLMGVVVLGRDKGTTFQVCVDRSCDVHWKKERGEPRRPAGEESDDGADEEPPHKETRRDTNRDVERQQWQAQQHREQAERAAYRIGAPAILAAFVARLKAAKVPVLADAVEQGAAFHPKAIAAFPHAKTAEDLLRVIALSFVAEELFNEWAAPQRVPVWAKRFGLDLKPLLKPATRKIAPQPKPSAKKKR